ncbi:MAG: hypothetical protein HKM07_08155 [Chlamydiae bacterium]|nr:hypothetical protein [Chlamydiota bacterium]
MGKILTLDQPNLSGKEPPKIKATVIFQDPNYTFMRNKENLTPEDVFNVPLHLFLISLGLLDAQKYVPRVGKKQFIHTLDKLKKQFNHVYKAQKQLAQTITEGEK